MTHLRLTNEEVATERQVIIEERRSRVDNNPSARLDEQMNAALYLSHPYGVPVIGWEHEMAKLSREDALRFYKRYYAPNNAILVVAGDVTVDEVKRLAEATYGKIPANPEVDTRLRPQEPPHIAARRLTLKDPRAGNASFHRYYVAPSYVTGQAGRSRSARPLDEDPRRRLDQPPLSQARRRGQGRGDDRRRLLGLQPGLRRHLALRGIEQRRPEAGRRRRRRRARRHPQERRHRSSSSSAPRRRCSPTTSTRATTRPTSPAATAGRSPSAARRPTSKAGRRRSPKSPPTTSRRRRRTISTPAAR